jgi:hypothetical protein
MVPCLHLADHPALQMGERLVEERRTRLSRGVWRAGEGAVLGLEGLGELAGQIFLPCVEEVQGEDATLFDQVVRVLVLADGDDDLLRIERYLRDPAGGEPVGLAVRANDARDVEAVGDGLQNLAARLLFHALLPLRWNGQMAFYRRLGRTMPVSIRWLSLEVSARDRRHGERAIIGRKGINLHA